MGDDVTGRPPPAARYIGGGDVPRRPEDEAVLVQALPGGEAIARLRFPGRFVQLQREMEMLRRLPYMFRRLDLTAAGTKEIDFEGNYLAVMRIAGAVAEGAKTMPGPSTSRRRSQVLDRREEPGIARTHWPIELGHLYLRCQGSKIFPAGD